MSLTREQIIEAIQSELVQKDFALALWEGGSTAMGRSDQWSDVDLQLLVADGQVEAAWQAMEAALQRLSTIELRYEVPQPSWHGHWQAFYRLAEASPFLLIDFCVIQQSSPNRFLEPEQHGQAIILFDKTGNLLPGPSEAAPMAEKLARRIPLLEVTGEMFHCFVDKEVARGRNVDAFHYYQSLVLGRLVEALRIRYAPWRFNFGLRYLSHELPPELYRQVEPLLFVANPQELLAKKEAAVELLRKTLAEVRQMNLVEALESARG